ncbi:TatD family hydrolase [Halotalea alkalilenta]|uniref:Hydrolase TatD n=1 Tax=Halotalea alkalilenta TaxID=376489 RepID=A0A172YGA6_9GAMM|nr:TatD family hydrolase [Halotalea alkalilenta]ANF58253.1 hypothetical protein A5892_12875 [Halotalea alkalilenta]
MLIDAHCHLAADAFDSDREAVIEAARTHGVRAFVCAATDRASWAPLLALAQRHAEVSVCLGLHPWFEHRCEGEDNDLDALERLLSTRPAGVVALGECGVDARSCDDSQWALFDAQLSIAERLRLPVVVHCVRLNDQVAQRLSRHPRLPGGLIHAFAGSLQQAERFLDAGFLLGIGGAVTFDRAQKLKRVVAALPEDGFVLETDSPDMLPAPLRGREQRNTPSNLPLVAAEVARLRGLEPARLGETTSANVRALFRSRA